MARDERWRVGERRPGESGRDRRGADPLYGYAPTMPIFVARVGNVLTVSAFVKELNVDAASSIIN